MAHDISLCISCVSLRHEHKALKYSQFQDVAFAGIFFKSRRPFMLALRNVSLEGPPRLFFALRRIGLCFCWGMRLPATAVSFSFLDAFRVRFHFGSQIYPEIAEHSPCSQNAKCR